MDEQYELVIFDKDGTICRNRENYTNFINRLDEQEMIPGVVEKCLELTQAGIILAVATNQGGVAFGYLSDAEAFELAVTARAAIDARYSKHSPFHPKGTEARYTKESWLRKPAPGMLNSIMVSAEVEPQHTLMVGDRPEDYEAAQRAGCDFMWAWQFFERDAPAIKE